MAEITYNAYSTPAETTLAVLQRNGLSVTEYFSKRILEMIKLEKENFVFTTLGVEQNLPKNLGTKTFTVRRYNHLPVGDHQLIEGKTPAALKPEGHKVSGTINQYGALMEETDVAADIHFDNIKTIYQPELARHAAEVIERNVLASFTDASEYFVGTGNDDVDDLDSSDILKFQDCRIVALGMKNANRKGHKKYNGKFVVVMHPNVMQDLLDDAVLLNKIMVPGNDNTPIKKGTLMSYEVFGMAFAESLICPVAKNSGNYNVYTSYCLGYEPYMVLKLGGQDVKFYDTGFTADKADPLAQKATFGYKLWTGAKIIDPMTITAIYSCSGYDIALYDDTNDTWGKAASQTNISA